MLRCGISSRSVVDGFRTLLLHARQLNNEMCNQQEKNQKKNSMLKPVCEFCGKEFSSTQTLRTHQLIHTGAFSCPICGDKYSLQTSLDKHISWHSSGQNGPCFVPNSMYEFTQLHYYDSITLLRRIAPPPKCWSLNNLCIMCKKKKFILQNLFSPPLSILVPIFIC